MIRVAETDRVRPVVGARLFACTASDGYRLHHHHWAAAARRPRAYVIALHGIQSHAGWYEYSSGRLAEAGCDMRFLDRRGSGANAAARGHAPHEERLINDVAQVLAATRIERDRLAPHAPVVLLAVSWGGKLAAAVAARRPDLVDALALSSPGIRPRIRPRWWQAALLRLAEFHGCLHGKSRVPLDDPRLFTADPRWQRFIRDDPRALRRVTWGFLLASSRLERIAETAAPHLESPLLMMLAGRDRIIDTPATRAYFKEIAAARKTLIEYPEAAHTLEFESNRDTWIDDLIGWIESVRTGGKERDGWIEPTARMGRIVQKHG
ncbi:MAG: alpha/beta fold hydrolase [Planctomycetaceae bacterium]